MKRIVVLYTLLLLALAAWAQQIEIAVQKGHSGDIKVVAFNHDGKLLASAGDDNLIKLWHVPTGKEMASFIGGRITKIRSLAFKGESDFLLVKYADGT
ncbi:MAG: WD40 repeat domain-containing protein, partial [Bacteroidota bacterium]